MCQPFTSKLCNQAPQKDTNSKRHLPNLLISGAMGYVSLSTAVLSCSCENLHKVDDGEGFDENLPLP